VILRLSDLFPLLLVSALAALSTGPVWVRVAIRLRLVDIPGSQPHKLHPKATPLAGGLVLGLSILAAFAVVRPEASRPVAAIAAGGALTLGLGLLDDRANLPPHWKFFGQIACSLLLIALGVQVHVTRVEALDVALSLLWYVGLINAFNFVDSMDGLAIGLAGIASGFFMLVSLDAQQPDLAALAASLMGACAGLTYHNISPARLFLGDSGASLLGLVVAGLGIAYTPGLAGLPQELTWFTPILVLGVPIFDASLVVFSRIRRRLPVYRGGRDHTYHRLVALGLEPGRSVLAMHLGAATLGLVAFIALDASVLAANLVFAAIVVGGVCAALWLDRGVVVAALEPLLPAETRAAFAEREEPAHPGRRR
jgi:UDP-GlcNAc:undecaprenyl-phosphate GlcNAc-1-phosphate transferase